MSLTGRFRSLTPVQRSTFAACFLGWTLDAFDFFLLTFCLTAIAADFHTGRKQIEEAIFLTLAMRPVGAFLFGAMAEKYGRRPTLILNIVAFSVFLLVRWINRLFTATKSAPAAPTKTEILLTEIRDELKARPAS